MRTYWLIATLALAFQAAPQAGVGAIQGRLVRAGGTEPVIEAQVFLNRGTTVAGAAAGQDRAGTAVSDSSGNFVFKDIAPGRYTITAQRKGYSAASISSPDPSVGVVVSAGQTAEVVLTMIPSAVIRGRVRDANGQFISNVAVDALVIAYANGLPYLMSAVSKLSDDRGEYRLYGIPPGDYYVRATPPPLSPIAALAGGAQSMKTFYPAAVDLSSATRIAIHGGEEISGIDVGIQTTPTFKISGRISNTVPLAPPPPTAQGAFVVIAQNQNSTIQMLLSSRDLNKPDDGGNSGTSVSVATGAAGPFEIQNVLPGSYDLVAVFNGNSEVPAIARTVVDVRNQDVGGLALTIRPGFSVKGNMTVDGKAPAANTARLAFEPADALKRLGVAIPANIEGDGSFTFPPGPDGRFRVAVARLMPDLYVEDIRQGGASIFDSGFEIRGRSPDPIQVLIKSGAGSLEGTVQDSSGKLLIGGVVALVPAIRRENPALYYNAIADSTGSFTIRGIAPGDYKLFAWDIMPSGAHYNAAFLEKYEERGIPMTIAVGGKLTSKVIAIPR